MGFASIGILIGGALVPGLAQSLGYPMAALAVSPIMIGAIWLSAFATCSDLRNDDARRGPYHSGPTIRRALFDP